MKLENAILELYKMFMDLAMIVEYQGDMMDRIEYHVEQSVDYIETAKVDTRETARYQRRAGRKKFMIVAVAVFLWELALIIELSVGLT